MSCAIRSSQAQPQASRVASAARVTLPNSRRAAPGSPDSSASNSRWERISRSRSSSRCLRRQNMSPLLGGPHHARDRTGEPLPFRFLLQKLLSPGGREPVVLELALEILARRLPLRSDPALALEAMQRRVEGAVLDLQHVLRG